MNFQCQDGEKNDSFQLGEYQAFGFQLGEYQARSQNIILTP